MLTAATIDDLSIVYFNDGTSTFTSTSIKGPVHQDDMINVQQLPVDLNNDGILDVVVLNQLQTVVSGTVGVADVFARGVFPFDIVSGASRPGFSSQSAAITARYGELGDTWPTTPAQAAGPLFADLDRDGDLDLIVRQTVFLNDGSGTFTLSSFLGVDPISLVDINGDGFADAIGADLVPYINDGAASFSASTGPISTTVGSYIVADVDGDGDYDVMDVDTFNKFENDGNGVFASATTALATGTTLAFSRIADTARQSAVGDINGDGQLDLIVCSFFDHSETGLAYTFINDGTGLFADAPTAFPTTICPTAFNHQTRKKRFYGYEGGSKMELADIDGDGDLDIVMANNPNQQNLYTNNGAGVFTAVSVDTELPCYVTSFDPSERVSCQARTLIVTDIDGDGDVDLILAHSKLVQFVKSGSYEVGFSRYHQIYLNDGSGTFTTLTSTSTFSTNEAIASAIGVADVDNDGDVDIILVQRAGDVEAHFSSACGGAIGARGPSGACYACPSFSRVDGSADRCIECDAHHEQGEDSFTCSTCFPGTDRHLGTDACSSCPAGTWTAGGGVGCSACSPGTFAPAVGSFTCTSCAAGTYTGELGSSSCTTAPVGMYATLGATASLLCAAGRYGSAEGRPDDQCSGACNAGHYCPPGSTSPAEKPCPAGTYYSATGARSAADCLVCPIGSYCPEAASSPILCISAFALSTTISNGAKNWTQCVCESSYYLQYAEGEVIPTCSPCATDFPAGVDCSNAGVSLEWLPVSKDYYRRTATARTVRKCTITGACLASNSTNQTLQCLDSQTGEFCSVCREGYQGGNPVKGIACTKCEGDPIATLTMYMAGGISAFCVLFFLLVTGKWRAIMIFVADNLNPMAGNKKAETPKMNENPNSLSAKITIYIIKLSKKRKLIMKWVKKQQVKLKIFLSLIQLLSGITTTFQIEYPPIITSITASAGAIELDVPSAMPLQCIFPWINFCHKLVMRTAYPLVLLAMFHVGSKKLRGKADALETRLVKEGKPPGKRAGAATVKEYEKADSWRGIADFFDDLSFFLVFALYPGCSAVLFTFFNCVSLTGVGEEVAGLGSRFLRADLSVDCDGAIWTATLPYVLVMMLIYPIGKVLGVQLRLPSLPSRKLTLRLESPHRRTHSLSHHALPQSRPSQRDATN